jgi:hypothetical protein
MRPSKIEANANKVIAISYKHMAMSHRAWCRGLMRW